MRRLPLPPLVDVREGVCLMLLCGAMVFSVLNIGVHRLAERLWEPINHGLSPNGTEYVSISLAGLRVHDIETGRELQRRSWRSPWVDSPHLDWLGQNYEDAYVFETRDESSEIDNHGGIETKATVEVAPTRRFVVGKFPGGCILWWDRQENRVRVTCFPDHIILHCFIDEGRDRFLLECIPYPKPFVQRPQDPEPAQPEPPNLLARRIDVIEFRLGTGEELTRHQGLRVGAPVDQNFDTRLIADSDGANPRLVRWTDYPRGLPDETLLAPCEGLDKIGMVERCRIFLEGSSVVVDEEDKRIKLVPREIGRSSGSTSLKLHRSWRPDWIYPHGAIEGHLDGWYDSDLLGVAEKENPNEFRFFTVNYTSRMCCTPAQNEARREVLRAADEKGRVYDLPTSRAGRPVYRQMRLAAFPHTFTWSLGACLLGFCFWLGNAISARTYFASRGWAVLFVVMLWPLFLWGLDLGLDHGGVAAVCRWILITGCGLILSLLGMILLSGARPLRPLCLSAVVVALLYCVCAWNEFFYSSYS